MQASKLKSPKQFKISSEVKAFSPDTAPARKVTFFHLAILIQSSLICSFAGCRMVKVVQRALIKVI